MSVKKRILWLVLIYIFNLTFFLLCLTIDRKGLFSTLRFDGGMIAIIGILFLNVSFSEMCMVLRRYYCKRRFLGNVCIALNMRCRLQKILYSVFYLSLLILAFCDTKVGILFCTFCFLAIITLFCGNTGRFLWIVEDMKYYMNECGEVYLVKEFENKVSECVMTYEDYRGKEYKVRIKREITW